jgi:hypothetical protein
LRRLREDLPRTVSTDVIRADDVGETAGGTPGAGRFAVEPAGRDRRLWFYGQDTGARGTAVEEVEEPGVAQADDNEEGWHRLGATRGLEPALDFRSRRNA